jgi:putative flippase GtrA
MIKKLIKKFFTPEIIKFIVVGGLSAIIEFTVLIIFVETIDIDYRVGNILAFGLTNILTFMLSKRYVFASSNSNKAQEATLYTLCLLVGLAVNQAVLWALVEMISIDYRIAKVIAILVTVVWNYFSRKHFVFKQREVQTQESTTKY